MGKNKIKIWFDEEVDISSLLEEGLPFIQKSWKRMCE